MPGNHRVLEAENQLLKTLLALPSAAAPDVELAAAISFLAGAMSATTGYLELLVGEESEPCFTAGYDAGGNDPVDTICRGVIARAVADNAPVRSSSARRDPRFQELGSVRRNATEAIACAPLAVGDITGVVCLQRSGQPGGFTDGELRLVDYFTQQVMLVAHRLVPPVPLRTEIRRLQVNLVRDALARTRGNVAQAARELKVARSFVYSVIRQ